MNKVNKLRVFVPPPPRKRLEKRRKKKLTPMPSDVSNFWDHTLRVDEPTGLREARLACAALASSRQEIQNQLQTLRQLHPGHPHRNRPNRLKLTAALGVVEAEQQAALAHLHKLNNEGGVSSFLLRIDELEREVKRLTKVNEQLGALAQRGLERDKYAARCTKAEQRTSTLERQCRAVQVQLNEHRTKR